MGLRGQRRRASARRSTSCSPALRQRDPALLETADAQFAAVLAALSTYKTADGYVDYSTVGKADRRQLTTLVNTLAETLSKVAPAIV